MSTRNTIDLLEAIGSSTLVRYGQTITVTYRQIPTTSRKGKKNVVDITSERDVCYAINQPIRPLPPEVISSRGWHAIKDATFSIRLQLDDWKRDSVGIYLVRIISFDTDGEKPPVGSQLVIASVRSTGECDLTSNRAIGTFLVDQLEDREALVVLHPDSSIILMLADVSPKRIRSAVRFRMCLFRSFV
jgi:hypothetical protein